MTYALPAGPRPAPRRQLFMSTGIAAAAGTMLMGGMLALWLRFRAAAPTRPSADGFKLIKDWLPADLKMPEVVTNVGILSFVVMCVMVQWAAYAARRSDSKHVVAALSLTLLFGIAILNAQAAIFVHWWSRSEHRSFKCTCVVLVFPRCGVHRSVVRSLRAEIGRRCLRQVQNFSSDSQGSLLPSVFFILR